MIFSLAMKRFQLFEMKYLNQEGMKNKTPNRCLAIALKIAYLHILVNGYCIELLKLSYNNHFNR